MTYEQAVTYPQAECDTCHAAIIWAVTEGRLQRMPVDAKPSSGGNVQLLPRIGQPPLARVLRKVVDRFGKTLYRSHFATCPHAAEHRRTPGRRTP